MPRNFKELEARMAPERLARAETKAKEILADMFLAEIRKQMGLTQDQLAKAICKLAPCAVSWRRLAANWN